MTETETRFEDGKLHVTRVYDAPREAVFEAWVATNQVEQWWGCAQTTAVTCEIEREVGGKYNHLMTIDGQHEHPSQAVFTIYDPPSKLQWKDVADASPAPGMVVTVTFTEVDGGTRVELVHEGIPDMEVPGGFPLRDIVRGGWTAAFGKLGGFLQTAA